jgi:hypothetical protein
VISMYFFPPFCSLLTRTGEATESARRGDERLAILQKHAGLHGARSGKVSGRKQAAVSGSNNGSANKAGQNKSFSGYAEPWGILPSNSKYCTVMCEGVCSCYLTCVDQFCIFNV